MVTLDDSWLPIEYIHFLFYQFYAQLWDYKNSIESQNYETITLYYHEVIQGLTYFEDRNLNIRLRIRKYFFFIRARVWTTVPQTWRQMVYHCTILLPSIRFWLSEKSIILLKVIFILLTFLSTLYLSVRKSHHIWFYKQTSPSDTPLS